MSLQLVSISNPYSSGALRRSSARTCIAKGSCVAARRQCTERIVAKYGTDWSSSRGPRNGRMLAIWPIRLVALTKCTVRPLNFRCGLFHPPPSKIRISRDDNSVIIFQYVINCGPLCPFTDTSLCRLGRDRLQIWEEPLRITF